VVVYFIGNDKEQERYFELLRERILNNTKMLISVYRERIDLAEKMTEIKNVTGKPVRDRGREVLVKNLINPKNELETAFLNMVFEYTIQAQLKNYEPFGNINNDRFCIKGDRDFLLLMSSRILCRPGDELFVNGMEDHIFIRFASSCGAHIISEGTGNHDFSINLKSFEGTEDIGFVDSDTITISTQILTRNKVCAKIRVEC
jgi:chorismate mutase